MGKLEDLARAYLEHERNRLGIPHEEQVALKSADDSLESRAKTALATQELGFGPANNAAALDLTGARAAESRSSAHLQDVQAGMGGYRPTNPPQPPNVGSFEDYMVRYAQGKGIDPKNLTPADIEAGRKAYQQADDRPRQASISLQLPMPVLDKRTGQMTYATREDVLAHPDMYGVPPTTAERNVASGSTAAIQTRKMAQERAIPILQDLGSRITTLNQGKEGGLIDRAEGVARGVGSKVGLDPATDLYRTGIRGFVPLFARAVGHTGVLTELDVQRTEELFPRVGDAEDVTAEKMARIQRIMTGKEPQPFQFEYPEYDSSGVTTGDSQPAAPSGPRRIKFDSQGNVVQ